MHAFYLVVVILLVVTYIVTAYLLLRNDGLVDHLIQKRDHKLKDLESTVKELETKIASMIGTIAQNASSIEHGVAQAQNRLRALETKYGIDKKRLNKEEIEEQFVREVHGVIQQSNQ